jgi:PAS domain S-box-containing protein
MLRNVSIRTHLLGLVLAVATPLAGLQAWSLYATARDEERHARERVLHLAQTTASETARFLVQVRSILDGLAARPAVKALDPAHCDPILKDFLGLAPRFSNVVTVSAEGIVVCSAVPLPGGRAVNVDPVEYARVRAAAGFAVGKPILGPITGRWLVPLARPLRDAQGGFAGAVVLTLDLVNLPVRPAGPHLPPGVVIGLFTPEGTVLARSVDAGKFVGTSQIDREDTRSLIALQSGANEGVGLDGLPRVRGVQAVPYTDWFAIASVPASEVYVGVNERSVSSALLGIAILCFALLAAQRLGRSIRDPIDALAATANEAAAGNPTARAPAAGPVEVVAVVEQFNRMLDERAMVEAGLKDAERRAGADAERFLKVFRRTPIPMAVTARDTSLLIDVNDAYCAFFGLPREEAIGHGMVELGLWADPADRVEWVRRLGLGGGSLRDFEARLRRRSGEARDVLINADLIDFPDVPCILSVLTDLTEVRAADRIAREAQVRFEKLFHAAPVAGTLSMLTDGRLIEVNESFCALRGQAREALIGRTPAELGTWADPGARAVLVEQLLLHGRVRNLEIRMRSKSGEIRVVLMSAERIAFLGEPCSLQMGIDITERRQAEGALRENQARLETLTRRLLDVQEIERRMIARELHDEVGGVLTAVKLNLQSLRATHAGDNNEAALADGIALVDGAIQSVRSLSLDLRPAVLDDLGLIPALRWYCERQSQRAGVPIELALDAIDLKAASQLETACFRVAQESVTNALRHANARHIRVTLSRSDGGIALEIGDDGAGFDPAEARVRGRAGERMGLLGMEERTVLLGGRFNIDTAPGGGTRIRAAFALPQGGFA